MSKNAADVRVTLEPAHRYSGRRGFCDLPLQHMIAELALLLNRPQKAAIEYLKEEKRLLKEKLGNCTLRFTNAVRQRLATRAKALGRQLRISRHRDR